MSYQNAVAMANEAVALVNGPGGGITAFTDQGRIAQLAQLFYEPARDAVLEGANWWFATKLESLAAPTSGDTYDAAVWGGESYELPSDCIRPIDLDPAINGTKDWTVVGRLVVTSVPSPVLRYVARIEDPTQFTPGFRQAVVCYMAWKFAYPLTESNTKVDQMRAMYEKEMQDARTMSASVGRPRQFRTQRSTEIRARRG